MLDHGYGVLVGNLVSHHRDTPDDQGRWFHVHLVVDVAGTSWEAAVDVDSAGSDTGVQWKTVQASLAEIGPVPASSPGFHALVSAPGTGALDHLRHRIARSWRVRSWWPLRLVPQPWATGTYRDASAALEHVLEIGAPVLVWGEPFTSGHGVHNVHQNQGDPPGSQWWDENGIWQDGGVAVAQPDGTYRLFLSKFTAQSFTTDADGHPARKTSS